MSANMKECTNCGLMWSHQHTGEDVCPRCSALGELATLRERLAEVEREQASCLNCKAKLTWFDEQRAPWDRAHGVAVRCADCGFTFCRRCAPGHFSEEYRRWRDGHARLSASAAELADQVIAERAAHEETRRWLTEARFERDSYIADHNEKAEALKAERAAHEATKRDLEAVRTRGANAVLVPTDKLAELRAAKEQAEAALADAEALLVRVHDIEWGKSSATERFCVVCDFGHRVDDYEDTQVYEPDCVVCAVATYLLARPSFPQRTTPPAATPNTTKPTTE